jgi:hypothetical protein
MPDSESVICSGISHAEIELSPHSPEAIEIVPFVMQPVTFSASKVKPSQGIGASSSSVFDCVADTMTVTPRRISIVFDVLPIVSVAVSFCPAFSGQTAQDSPE